MFKYNFQFSKFKITISFSPFSVENQLGHVNRSKDVTQVVSVGSWEVRSGRAFPVDDTL